MGTFLMLLEVLRDMGVFLEQLIPLHQGGDLRFGCFQVGLPILDQLLAFIQPGYNLVAVDVKGEVGVHP